MTIPTRSFDGVPGQRSAGTGGPNQLETDLDNLFNHLDPALHGIQTENIKDLNVTEAKIAANAVTEGKIGTGAVTETKIGAAAVTADKIGALAVTEAKINTAAVTADKIDTGAVTEDKIGAGAVSDTALGTRTISQTIADAFANTGVLTTLLSWIAKAIKSLVGADITNWYDVPPFTLTDAHAHTYVASAAHAASAISFTPTAEVASSTVQAAIAEIGVGFSLAATDKIYIGLSTDVVSSEVYKLRYSTDTSQFAAWNGSAWTVFMVPSTVTATGDMLYATSAGVIDNLPIGSTGQALVVNAAQPFWGESIQTLLNAKGKMLYSNDTAIPTALDIGNAGEVLTVVDGVPVWQEIVSSSTGSTLYMYQNYGGW